MYSLEGINGNAFSVMGYVTECMKREGKTKAEIKEYTGDTMSGDYNNLLCVSIDIIDSLNEQEKKE